MYKVYSFLISLSPPRAPRWKKRCYSTFSSSGVKEVKGVKGVKEVKTTAFMDTKLTIKHSLQGCYPLTSLTTGGSDHIP